MDPQTQVWFVRLPDGRVVRAKSLAAVRYHIETGRIPATSRVRRNAEEDWLRLDWLPEFADLFERGSNRDASAPAAPAAPAGPAASRPASEPELGKSVEFRTIGVRGLVNELWGAADSSLNHYKLWIAGMAALVWSVGILAWRLFPPAGPLSWSILPLLSVALVLALAAGFAGTLINEMTFIELSRLRGPRWREIRPGLIRNAMRITSAQALVLGGAIGLLTVLNHFGQLWQRFLPDYEPSQILVGAVLSLQLTMRIVFWPLVGVTLLLGPVVVVEECSFWRALLQWFDMLRRDLSRIFLYETLALAMGLVLTAPLVIPVVWVAWSLPAMGAFLNAVSLATLHVLGGLALTPLVAYLLVANVFIYLNLRYEFFYSADTGARS